MRFESLVFGNPLVFDISEYDSGGESAVYQVCYSPKSVEYFEAPRDLPDETLVERAVGTLFSSGIEWWRRLPDKEEN